MPLQNVKFTVLRRKILAKNAPGIALHTFSKNAPLVGQNLHCFPHECEKDAEEMRPLPQVPRRWGPKGDGPRPGYLLRQTPERPAGVQGGQKEPLIRPHS